MRMYPEPSDRMMNVKPVKPNKGESFIDNFIITLLMSLAVLSILGTVVCLIIMAYQKGGIILAVGTVLPVIVFVCSTDSL